jgi:catechol 2,3-dioxygenase-like lactoylglutathione lyase family enzyme
LKKALNDSPDFFLSTGLIIQSSIFIPSKTEPDKEQDHMGVKTIFLDHISINVTNIDQSRKFYRDVLHMTVTEPISLREQSTGLKYGHSLITHGPRMVKDWIGKTSPTAIQHMYTDICHCSAANGKINLILVQQTHPEKGHQIQVNGHTIYGFSYYLSPDIDTDDLAWDLNIADISFEHGDTRTDGTLYTPGHDSHSLYVRDPDGRMIELLSTGQGETGKFITSPGHVVLYVSDMRTSTRYYQQTLGLSDITPVSIPRDPWKKNITWIGIPGNAPVILLYQVTNPDGTRVEQGGYGLDHIGISGIPAMHEGIVHPPCIVTHPPAIPGVRKKYLQDPDGYLIELSS